MVVSPPPASIEADACPGCGAVEGRLAIVGHDRLLGRPERFGVAICGRCGLAFTTPRPDPSELGEHYGDDYTPHGAASRSRLRELVARAKVAVGPFRAVGGLEPGRILDVGCGHGRLGEWLIGRGWRVEGVEPFAAAAERARARGIAVNGATFEAAELRSGYDAVLFNHSLEHLADPFAALEKAFSLLRPGGYVVIAVPDFGGWQRRLFRSRWFHLDLPRHLVHFDAPNLARALTEAGFREIRTRPSVTSVGFWASVQYAVAGRCVLSGRGRLAGLALADLLYPLLFFTRPFGGDVIVVTARR